MPVIQGFGVRLKKDVEIAGVRGSYINVMFDNTEVDNEQQLKDFIKKKFIEPVIKNIRIMVEKSDIEKCSVCLVVLNIDQKKEWQFAKYESSG